MGIDPQIPALQLKDFPAIRRAAFKEANSTYAVPAYMSADDAQSLMLSLAKSKVNKRSA